MHYKALHDITKLVKHYKYFSPNEARNEPRNAAVHSPVNVYTERGDEHGHAPGERVRGRRVGSFERF